MLAVSADPRAVTARFYARLFELAPSARALFPADLQSQQEKFATTIATVIDFADDPAPLIDVIRRIGARHIAYGTQPHHYALVGEALLWTLNCATPGGLLAEARAAWRAPVWLGCGRDTSWAPVSQIRESLSATILG